MKITAVNVFQVDLPLREGSYRWSGGKSVTVFDSTVVELVTDAGISGWGEVCPLGPVYLPAYAAGCRAGIAEVAPALIGADPTRIGAVNRLMNGALAGHPYVKSALDMACWDLLGKASGQPVCTLLGSAAASATASRCTGRSRKALPTRWPVGSPATAPRATAASNSRWAARHTKTWRACVRWPQRCNPATC